MNAPIRLALVWHFHQPDYTDPATGAPAMPWTRLHALKDYADMAAHLERHPAVKATFNVVPTLIDQLEALASATAPPDPFLAAAEKPAAELSADERLFVVAHFFSLQRERMTEGLPRFRELAARRGHAPAASIGRGDAARFDEQDLLDLQVLFHLAWSGPLLQADPVLEALRRKGRGFNEEDKKALFARQRAFLADVLPHWRRLYDHGQIELSVSPYYHPILPLLCDTSSAHEALPDLRLPRTTYRHPEDAEIQLEQAMDAFERSFGRRAAGGWPSEGAISEAALGALARAGYGWAASDEDVLFASLEERLPADRDAREARRAALLYRPYRLGAGPVLLFRDHDLSDRIGFTYASRPAAEAARDFVDRLLHLRRILPEDGSAHVVSVILDGENAWEHFPGYAAPFFDALYGALASEPGIRTVTATEAAAPHAAAPLKRLVAGSWIYRNLATWVGHPEKNRAWDLLAEARGAIAAARGAPAWGDPAWRAIFAGEGSDWFWWFGDDHPTEYAAEFDAGFREKLRGAYRAAALPPPSSLDEPVRRVAASRMARPTGRVEALLDGRITDFFEWRAAGRVPTVHGAMHSVVRMASELYFGTDGIALYIRLDPAEPGSLDGTRVILRTPDLPEDGLWAPAGTARNDVVTALDRILELRAPLGRLAAPGETVRFAVEIRDATTGATQRIPADGYVVLPSLDDDASRYDWSA